MSGRAGRRGLDDRGIVIQMVRLWQLRHSVALACISFYYCYILSCAHEHIV